MSRASAQLQARRLTSKGERAPIATAKPFEPGTTGWTVHDLDDPHIESQWFSDRYEIIEGVLTKMPPAYFDAGFQFDRFLEQIKAFERKGKREVTFGIDIDIVIDDQRVVRADAVMLTTTEVRRFRDAATKAGKTKVGRQRVYVAPTLIIESASEGHQQHDRKTKFKWYAEFGVKHYWIFEPLKRSLDCFMLSRGKYKLAADGIAPAKVKVPLFDGLSIDLKSIFKD